MDLVPAHHSHRATASLTGGAVALAYALLSLLLGACASGWQTAPPGGPPDSTAPAIEITTPANGTVNFSGRTLSFTFSEYIEESKAPASVVITPIPVKQPEFDWSGRTLEITFAEPLLPDRTYAVTVGSAVTDLAGNRLGHPVTLRFSTGEHIDSGRIAGRVMGHAKGKAFIFGYRVPEDTAGFNAAFRPDTVPPDFIAPIGDDGTFTLEGLPTGRFRLLAVVDEYGDQLYTPGQDAFGAAPNDIVLVSQSAPLEGVTLPLRAAPEDLTPPALYSARSLARTFTELKLSEPLDTAGLSPANVHISVAGADMPVTKVWRSRLAPLLLQLEHGELPAGAEAKVTLSNLRDTVGNRMPDSAATATFTVAATADTLAPALLPLPVDSARAYSFGDSILIAFDRPVRAGDLAGAVTMRDSSRAQARFRLEQSGPSEFIARPVDTLIGVQRAVLEIALGRFAGLGGARRDSVVKVNVGVALPRQNGTLQGSITDSAAPNATHVVVLRAAAGGAIYRRTLKTGRWEFASLPEGEYEVSAFRDVNGDGVYGFGSAVPYVPAEPGVTWQGTVRVRPRWTTKDVDLVVR